MCIRDSLKELQRVAKNIVVNNCRIDDLKTPPSSNVIFVSRAYSHISKTILDIKTVSKKNNISDFKAVLHKGKDFQREINESSLNKDDYMLHNSITDKSSKIIEITKW